MDLSGLTWTLVNGFIGDLLTNTMISTTIAAFLGISVAGALIYTVIRTVYK